MTPSGFDPTRLDERFRYDFLLHEAREISRETFKRLEQLYRDHPSEALLEAMRLFKEWEAGLQNDS